MTTRKRKPGAGRKKGSPNTKPHRIHPTAKARALAYDALESDHTPLEIMLEAARFFICEARRLRVLPTMCEARIEYEGEDGPPKVRVVTAHAMYIAAAECAKKAAPFVHPQLSSVEHKVNAEFESAVLTLDEAARQVAGFDNEEESPDRLH